MFILGCSALGGVEGRGGILHSPPGWLQAPHEKSSLSFLCGALTQVEERLHSCKLPTGPNG